LDFAILGRGRLDFAFTPLLIDVYFNVDNAEDEIL
jgi:hypothetical protein